MTKLLLLQVISDTVPSTLATGKRWTCLHSTMWPPSVYLWSVGPSSFSD